MKIRKIAATPEQDIRKLKDDIKDLKRDLKSAERDIKEINKAIDSLNIGSRRFWQQQTTFTSLQRKVERFEKMEIEWKKFKEEMEDSVRKEIEKRFRAQVKL